jgi:hypothetical protein
MTGMTITHNYAQFSIEDFFAWADLVLEYFQYQPLK